jgi:hypothetical protein
MSREEAIRDAVLRFQERYSPQFPLAVEALRNAERVWNETIAEPIPEKIASVLRRLA